MILLKFRLEYQNEEYVAVSGGQEYVEDNVIPDEVYAEYSDSFIVESEKDIPMNYGFTCSVL